MTPAIHDAPARQKSGAPSSPIGQAANCQVDTEALWHLLTLDIGELRQQWRGRYKTPAPPTLSRALLEVAGFELVDPLGIGAPQAC